MKWFLYERRWLLFYVILIGVFIALSFGLKYLGYVFDYAALYVVIFVAVFSINFLPTLFFSLCGLLKQTPSPVLGELTEKNVIDFLIIIPAYNEKNVILNSVNSLLAQSAGTHHTARLIVAFNGQDETGNIAAAAGAEVITTPVPQCGKSKAIEYVLSQVSAVANRYVVIIDADNIVDKNYLSELATACQTGCVAYQSNHQPLLVNVNWVSKGLQAAYYASSRLFNEGRSHLLGSALLCGTGMVIQEAVLRNLWQKIKTQTEDIELNGLLSLHFNAGVRWVSNATFYDEKPDRIDVAIRQRVRWMVGHYRCAYYYSMPLLKKSIQDRSWRDFELAVYYLIPVSLLASTLWLLLLIPISLIGIDYESLLAPPIMYAISVCFLLYILLLPILGYCLANPQLVIRQRILNACLYSLYAVLFALVTWPIAIIMATVSLDAKGWMFHTPHKARPNAHESTQL